jgi:hypothetical protein
VNFKVAITEVYRWIFGICGSHFGTAAVSCCLLPCVCVWHYLWKMAQNILPVIVFLCLAHYKSVVKLNTPVVLNVLR